MFSEFLNAILRTLDMGRAPIPRVPEALKPSFEREARRALSHALRVPPLSERRAEPKVYAALQRERRRDLEALLLCGDGGEERVLDILCAICEESRWAEGPGAVFEDETHPEIDLQAADTAALLGWAWHLRGAALGVDGRAYTRGFCRKPAGAYCSRWSPATTTCAPRRSTAPPSRRFYSLKTTASASFWRSSRFCAVWTPPAPAQSASARPCRRGSRTHARLPTLRRSCAASAPEPPISRAMCRARLGWMRYSLPMCRRTGFLPARKALCASNFPARPSTALAVLPAMGRCALWARPSIARVRCLRPPVPGGFWTLLCALNWRRTSPPPPPQARGAGRRAADARPRRRILLRPYQRRRPRQCRRYLPVP